MKLDLKCADDRCLSRAINSAYFSTGGFSQFVCECMYVSLCVTVSVSVCVPCKHKGKCRRCIYLDGQKHRLCILSG